MTLIVKIIAYAVLGLFLAMGGFVVTNTPWLFLGVLVSVTFIEYLGWRTGKDGKDFL